MRQFLDKGNLAVIILTFVLFVAALFLKGFTKDLLLEAGVLLVSIKLILMNYKQSIVDHEMLRKLERIESSLADLTKQR